MKIRTSYLIALATVLVLALIVVFRGRSSTMAPAEVAARVVEAVGSGNVAGLSNFQHDHEKTLMPLSEDNLRDIVNYVRSEILTGARATGPIRKSASHIQGTATTRYEQGPYSAEFSIVADSTPDGGKVCLSMIVIRAISTRLVLKGESHENADWRVHRAKVAHDLTKHKGAFDTMGLRGVVGNHPDSRLMTWDRYIEVYGEP